MRAISTSTTVVVVVGLLTPFGLRAQAAAVESTSVVVATGSGEVTLAPDWAIVSFSLVTRDQSAAQASARNRTLLAKLTDTLSRAIGPRDSVRVVALDISPAENYDDREIVGYDAGAWVEVVLRNLDRLAAVLDAAFGAGATTTRNGVEFKSDRAEAAKREALAEAFEDARLQAEALARAAGLTLGPVVQVTTQPTWDGPMPMAQAISVTMTATSVTPSDVVVRASVQARWRLRGSSR
jgi:hypothetical protein